MKSWYLVRAAVAASAMAFVFGCSVGGEKKEETPAPDASVGEVARGTVGATGGSVAHSAGARLDVPPGALPADVQLSVEVAPAPASGTLQGTAASDVFLLGPEGQQFAQPIRITIPIDRTRLPQGVDPESLVVMTAPRGSTDFQPHPTRLEGDFLVADTTHFTQAVAVVPPPSLFVLPGSLPPAIKGTLFQVPLTTRNGTGPFTYQATTALPPGFSLDALGNLSGVPTSEGTYSFTVRSTDTATGRSIDKPYLVYVSVTVPQPWLSSLSPTTTGDQRGVTLVLSGANFVRGAKVLWNGSTGLSPDWTRSTDTRLYVHLSDSLVATPGTYPVRVSNPPPSTGGDPALFTSNALDFKVVSMPPSPVPTLSAIAPVSVPMLSGDTAFTLTGSNFVESSKVVADGAGEIPTTYVSATELRAVLPAKVLSLSGKVAVRVNNPAPGGGTSSPVAVKVVPPTPTITSVTPTSGPQHASTEVTITGTHFAEGLKLLWNGTARDDVYFANLTPTSVRVTLNQFWVDTVGTIPLAIGYVNPDGGYVTSNSVGFEVTPSNPKPYLYTVDPWTIPSGSGDTQVTITGWDFVEGMEVFVGTTTLSSTFVSASEVKATLPAALLASPTSFRIDGRNPAPGGGVGTSAAMVYVAKKPVVDSVTPSSAPQYAPGVTLTITGSNFDSGAKLVWNNLINAAVSPSSCTATSMTVTLPSSYLGALGTFSFVIENPLPTTSVQRSQYQSAPQSFQVLQANPVPVVTSVQPAAVTVGANDTQVTVTGSAFVDGAVAEIGGQALATFFHSSTELYATVPSTLLATVGTLEIKVRNPEPGGYLSTTSASLAVTPPPPVLTAISPTRVPPGMPNFELRLTASNIPAQYFNDGIYVGATRLALNSVTNGVASAIVPASLVTSAGSLEVTYRRADGATSNALSLQVAGEAAAQVFTPATGESLASFAADDTGIYYAVALSDGTYQVRKLWTDGSAQVLVSTTGGMTDQLCAAGGQLYFAVRNADGTFTMRRTPSYGGPTEVLGPAMSGGTILCDAEAAYYLAKVTGYNEVRRVEHTAGAAPVTLTKGGPDTYWSEVYLAADATSLYLAQRLTANAQMAYLMKLPKSVSAPVSPETLNVAAFFTGLAVDDGSVYFTGTIANVNALRRVAKTGGTPVTMDVGNTGPTLAARDGGLLYFLGSAANTAGLVQTVPTTGGATSYVSTIASASKVKLTTSRVVFQAGNALYALAKAGVPVIASLSPAETVVGATDLTLTVTMQSGTLPSGAVVKADGTALATTQPSADVLGATLPAAMRAKGGTVQITVSANGVTSGPATLTVKNPVPVLTLLEPDTITAGTGVTLLVTGEGLIQGGSLLWGETTVDASVSADGTQATAWVNSELTATAGTVAVRFSNPAPGGGRSEPLTFEVTEGSPPGEQFIGSCSSSDGLYCQDISGPATTEEIASLRTLCETSWTSIWSPTAHCPTTNRQGVCALPWAYQGPNGQVMLRTDNSYYAGFVAPNGLTTEAYCTSYSGGTWTASPPSDNPVPSLRTISPTGAWTGGSFTLTVSGSDFVSGGLILFGGEQLPATVEPGGAQASVFVPSTLTGTAGTVEVRFVNPTPGGGQSAAQTFTLVDLPTPVVTGVTPSQIETNTAQTFTLTGTDLLSGQAIFGSLWVSASPSEDGTSATFTVPATVTTGTGAVQVRYVNFGSLGVPSKTSTTSATVTIVQGNFPVPNITTLNPVSVRAGSGDLRLILGGSGVVPETDVFFGTTEISRDPGWGTTLIVQIPASVMASVGTKTFRVVNPAPGGGETKFDLPVVDTDNPLPVLTSVAKGTSATGTRIEVKGKYVITDGRGGASVRFGGWTDIFTFTEDASYSNPADPEEKLFVFPVSKETGTRDVAFINPGPGGGVGNSMQITLP